MASDSRYRIRSLVLDDDLRRVSAGRTLIGGSPLRLMRLTTAGATMVGQWAGGLGVSGTDGAQALARRLLATGMAHPAPDLRPADPTTVTVVIPAFENPSGLDETLWALSRPWDGFDTAPGPATIIVDDGSAPAPASSIAESARRHRAQLIVLAANVGPAGARNAGWRASTADFIAFVDADVLTTNNWLDPLMAHFDDPDVAAVAPRVRSGAGMGADESPRPNSLSRYEKRRSALDMGPRQGRVAPRTRVAYVPTAALVVRRSALAEVGGFDESMRVGEDVDFVWRLVEAGHEVRYEPASTVHHRQRKSWLRLANQRRTYGTAAADLERRHPAMVTPVETNVWSLVSWALVGAGGRVGVVAGTATAFMTATGLVTKLDGRVDDPVREAARLGGLGHLHAGRWLAGAITRAWLPGFVIASALSFRIRRATVAAIVVPSLIEWWKERPDIDPIRWVCFRLLDDASYCVGVWQGGLKHRSIQALKPKLTNITGLSEPRQRFARRSHQLRR